MSDSDHGAPVHGGVDLAELRRLGLDPREVLDFSVCTNPFGPAPAIRTALADAAIDRYPDLHCRALREAIALALQVELAWVLPGNGSSELIWLTALAFLRTGDRALILGPTYSEYARAASLVGAHVVYRVAEEEDNFAISIDDVERDLSEIRPRVLFLCNPNNPSGRALPAQTIALWAGKHPDTLFAVDEAYRSFVPSLASTIGRGDNILTLRSMTKDHGLAGLRLGYAIGSRAAIARLSAAQPPWSVNAMAQAAGVAALRERTHLASTMAQLRGAVESLRRDLVARGLDPLPSSTHFFLLRVGPATEVRATLLRRGILVRDCSSFGLPAHIRIAARCPEENLSLVDALVEVLR